jgi:AAA domain-containing protein
VVDEAGMLDQDTARALLAVADECRVRIALLGDLHQLAAVGRGGVLVLALRATDPAVRPTLDTVHRFVHTDDPEPYGHVAGTRAIRSAGRPRRSSPGNAKLLVRSGGRGIRTHEEL